MKFYCFRLTGNERFDASRDLCGRDSRAVSSVSTIPATAAICTGAVPTAAGDFREDGTPAAAAAGPAVPDEAAAAAVQAVPAGRPANEADKAAAAVYSTTTYQTAASTGKESEYFSHTNTLIFWLHAFRP